MHELLELKERFENLERLFLQHGHKGSDFSRKLNDVSINARHIDFGVNEIVVRNTDNFQGALDELRKKGGGIIRLTGDTYKPTSNITFPANTPIQIVGENMTSTVIDFGSADRRFILAGTGIYTTGTVSITAGVTVTGVTTAWLSSGLEAGDQIFLDSRWYEIAVVGSDTSITLAEGYGGSALSGATYRAGTIVKDIEFKELSIENSTSTSGAIDCDDVRNVFLEDVQLNANNKGLVVTNFSEWIADRVILTTSTGDGATFTTGEFCSNDEFVCTANGGHGFVLLGVSKGHFQYSSAPANTGDGFNVTSCESIVFLVASDSNGGQGIELVSGNDDLTIVSSVISSNTSDGIKLTATSDNCRILGTKINNNGGYGVNIAASTCDNNIITTNVFASNTSGAVNDTGTGTVIRGNVGVDDNATSNLVQFGGDGSDGALSISSGTTTIDLSSAELAVKNYTSISITGTGVLAFSNPAAGGSVVILKSQGNVTITSSATRAIDMRSLGSTGGTGGAPDLANGNDGTDSNLIIDDSAHYGGAGADAGGSAAGAQITQGNALYSRTSTRVSFSRTVYLVPGPGGGGGEGGNNDGGTGGTGGTGGRGAGALYIECAGAYNVTGTIDLSGANGSVGTNATTNGSGGGGGGGGGGGMFLALYNTLTADSGTYTVTGGTGGAAGSSISGSGADGGGGAGTTEAAGTAGTTGVGATSGGGGAGAAGVAVRMVNIF